MNTPWQENDLIVNDELLHFYELGDPGHPPLVLVHGFSDNGLCWLDTANELNENYRIIMPDARGHGKSERLKPNGIIDYPADLAGIIRGLGIEKPIVAGHSMGGIIASSLAARFPDLVGALILEDPAWWINDRESPRFAGDDQVNPLEIWIRNLVQLPKDRIFLECREEHPVWSDNVIHYWNEGKLQLDLNIFKSVNFHEFQWQEVVKEIKCPTLLITANPERGGIITPEVISFVKKSNNLFKIETIPEASHHIRFDCFEAYMKVFFEFLKSLQKEPF